MEKFDVVVIGGGPGGYVAAIRCANLGLRTALVEKEHLGGICLNWGCIPTKALLKSAELLQKIRYAEEFGIKLSETSVDIAKIVARSRDVSSKLTGGIKGLLKKSKVTVFEGVAKIVNPQIVSVQSKDQGKEYISLETGNIIIATGARARVLDGFAPDGRHIWTYKEALVPKSIPKSMIIVGSGAIGIEFASFYNALGCSVTVLEAAERILPVEDAEISALAKKSFENRGIKFYNSVRLESQKITNNKVIVNFEANSNKISLDAEILLMAVGIVANTEGIGLEGTKIKLDRGHIVTSAKCRTDETNIYAIGDVAGSPWLAHKASHEGIITAEDIALTRGLAGSKEPHGLNRLNIPGCTYSLPQIASVGLTEEKAKESGYQLKIGRFPFYANGKALILGDSEGLIKTIFDAKTGELLGAHMIGTDVTELIQGYVIAKNLESTELELMETVFAHPTLSEMMHEAVLQAYNRQIHI